MNTIEIILLVICILLAVACAFLFFYIANRKKKQSEAKAEAKHIIDEANKKAEEIVSERKAQLDKENLLAKEKVERELSQKRSELDKLENKLDIRERTLDNRDDITIKKETMLTKREESISKKEDGLDKREELLDKRELNISTKEEQLETKREEYEQRIQALDLKDKELQTKLDSILSELEKIAGMTIDQARAELMSRVEQKEMKKIALYKEQMEEKAESECRERAKVLLTNAMEKYAQEVTCERSTSTVALPTDEMKGRIIGREGRNIKSMEALFGVSLIIDDTPETLTVSCFDSIRREKAKRTLEMLIHDGRIQPGRIEEVYAKVSSDFDEELRKIGEQTTFKLGLRVSSGLLPYIGRLKYRTSFGQNVLDHSIQVAYLASVMASELGLDPIMAKRAGLLHDIGKSIDAEQEGSHVQLGRDLAKKFNEPAVVINAIESHHGDYPKTFLISELVTAADTLSAARPGARSETLETYIKRLEQLEEICKSFAGVQSSYALQSGRDVRVMVVPEKVSDEDAKVIATQIAERIENELQFPGQIKVSVIRETRAVEIAK